jgi:hypothetical protein
MFVAAVNQSVNGATCPPVGETNRSVADESASNSNKASGELSRIDRKYFTGVRLGLTLTPCNTLHLFSQHNGNSRLSAATWRQASCLTWIRGFPARRIKRITFRNSHWGISRRHEPTTILPAARCRPSRPPRMAAATRFGRQFRSYPFPPVWARVLEKFVARWA